jgi:hypothetical protein
LGERTGEINGTVVVGIDLVDHILQLRLGGVLAEGAHDGAKLLGGDFSYRSQIVLAGFNDYLIEYKRKGNAAREKGTGCSA